MCYSGVCRFELSDGGCMVYNHFDFYGNYGEVPCIVGGIIFGDDVAKYVIKNQERLDAIYEQWCKDASQY